MRSHKGSVLVGIAVALICLLQILPAKADARADQPGLAGYRVFALDECVNSGHNNNPEDGPPDPRGEAAAGITGAAMSILVDTGLSMLIASIQRAGNDRSVQYNAISGIERGNAIPSCLYLIKGTFEPQQPSTCTNRVHLFRNKDDLPGGSGSATPVAPEKPESESEKRGVCLTEPYDLALELELHFASENVALAIRPIFVHLNRPEQGRNGPRDFVIFSGLMPPAAGAIDQTAIGNEKNGASLAHIQLSRVPITERGIRIEGHPLSGWVPLGSTVEISGGTTNAVLLVTETKKGNAFMKQLAEVLGAQKTDVSNALKDEMIESRRNTVAATQAGSEAAYYEELGGYETQLSVVRSACVTFLSTTSPTEGQRAAVAQGVAVLNSKAAKVRAKAVVIGKDYPRSIDMRSEANMCGSEPLAVP